MNQFRSILTPQKYSKRKKVNGAVQETQVVYSENFKAHHVGTDYVRPLFDDMIKISGSKDAFDILIREWTGLDHFESFVLMFLNRANRMLAVCTVSQGGVTGTVADPKLIYQHALACNASGVILAHNHPSGNATASQADIDLTKKLKSAGKFLEIEVLDHIILCDRNRYFSFADEGIL